MARAKHITKIDPKRADIPKGHTKVIYLGAKPSFAIARPWTIDEEGDVVEVGRTIYVFDQKDEKGNRYITTNNPFHVWSFLLYTDGEGTQIFEVELKQTMRNKIKALQGAYKMLDPQRGNVMPRREAEVIDATLAAMA